MPQTTSLSPLLSRFMCICAGYGGRNQTPASQQSQEPPKSPTRALAEKTLLNNPVLKYQGTRKHGTEALVHIDKTTAIPIELYRELMQAGERAKNGGQHQLREHHGAKPHLTIVSN